MSTTQPGRRERNATEKLRRIRAAAARLFDERGFEGATTQEIAERADVGAGTLFRYAATKGELFLMVFNDRFSTAIDAGDRAAQSEDDPARAVSALVGAVLTHAQHAENSAVYQRELLFGSPTEKFRAEGLAQVARLETLVAARLLAAAPTPDPAAADALQAAAGRAARSVFAVLNLLLVQPLTGVHAESDAAEELRAQVTQIIDGFLASATAAPTR